MICSVFMRLLERLEAVGRRRRLADNTIICYRRWVEQFFRFARVDGRWRTPGELRGVDVAAFLTPMAVERRLSSRARTLGDPRAGLRLQDPHGAAGHGRASIRHFGDLPRQRRQHDLVADRADAGG